MWHESSEWLPVELMQAPCLVVISLTVGRINVLEIFHITYQSVARLLEKVITFQRKHGYTLSDDCVRLDSCIVTQCTVFYLLRYEIVSLRVISM